MRQTSKIVILGAGFSGVYTAQHLLKDYSGFDFTITIVNKTNYFLFTPLLHEVATGGLNRQHVVESIREIFRGKPVDFYLSEARKIDFKKKIVFSDGHEIPYDFLVIASGSETHFHNILGAKEHAFTLKSLSDANRLRDHFIATFELASKISDDTQRRRLLSFAVIGGGPTGIELIAEMAELFFETFQQYYPHLHLKDDVTLFLVHRGSELMPQFSLWLRKKAKNVLTKKGVQIRLGSGVSEITNEGIFLSNQDFLPASTVVWVAGVQSCFPEMFPEPSLDVNNRIVVDSFLRVKGYENVFALGDIACFLADNENPLPMLAQVSVSQSDTVAMNIKNFLSDRPLKPFRYRLKGILVSLGRWKACGEIFGFHVSGPFAWFLWRTIYFFKFVSMRKRFKIALDWTLNIFYPRDISQTH
ncbi:NAD(P)/FAD-dependent oxidoreductase [Candidatus Peregrinibacteria bacterium]|nr:NAD(P)/FAD-dependent oxidoreductase [Candidatus Peregrinibacteria bacterium]